MSPELIAIIAVGIMLFGVQITTLIYLLQRMDKIEVRLTALEVGQAELKANMASLEAGLKGEMKSLEAGLKGEMKSLEAGLKGEMKSLEAGLRGEMADLRVEMVERMTTWKCR